MFIISTSRWIWLIVIALSSLGIKGCVTSAEHLSMKRSLGSEILDLRQRRDQNTQQLDKFQKEHASLQAQLQKTQQSYADLSKQHQTQIDTLNSEISKLKSQIDGLKTNADKCGEMLQGRGKQLYELQAELNKKQQELQDKEQAFARTQEEFNKKNQDLSDSLRKKELEIQKQQTELKSSLEQVKRLRKQVDGLQQVYVELTEKLKSLVQAGNLRIQMIRGMLVLQLPEKILFTTGSAKLKQAGQRAIAQVTASLKTMPYRWQVVGHTDDTGSPSFNWRLSSQRALSVLSIMLKEGMSAQQLSLAGFGQYQPTASNDTPDNRALNRRTELILVPDLSHIFSSVDDLPAPAKK